MCDKCLRNVSVCRRSSFHTKNTGRKELKAKCLILRMSRFHNVPLTLPRYPWALDRYEKRVLRRIEGRCYSHSPITIRDFDVDPCFVQET